MSGILDTWEAFWKAREKPDGYRKASKYNKVVKEGGKVTYYLWDNPIAVLEGNILTLRDCGWKTVTTKDRLNGILRGCSIGMRVEQDRNVWYLRVGEKRYQWSGGAEIDLKKPTARLKPISEKKIAEKSAEFAEKVSRFVREFKRRVDNGTLAMGGDECWKIALTTKEGERPLGTCEECEVLGTTQCGGGIRLIAEAVGRGNLYRAGLVIADSEGKASLDKIRENWKDISHDLRYWLKKKLMLREVARKKSVEERVTDKVQATAGALQEIASGEG